MTKITSITGPAGNIEAMISEPSGETKNVAVLCHPHPLYGGSMHDGVLQIAASALLEHDITAVSYTHLRAHETLRYLVCRLLLEKKK